MKINSRLTRAAMMLAIMLLTTASAWALKPERKIVVIADPHVMGNDLQDGGTAWQNYLADSRKLIDKSQTLFDKAVSDIKEQHPLLVLIVGDLTKDGEQASHDYVKGKLDELNTAGIRTLVIPGNHDLGTSEAKIYSGDATSPATTIGTASAFATFYEDYGYGASSERLENTLTYACEPIEGLVVIGIDSGTDGVLSSTTLNWVCTKALAARAAGKQVIAMMHHPLIPHITGGNMFVDNVSVSDYANVRNRLADAGIRVIFTGHFHTSDIAKDWNADKSETIYDVTTGSLCSYPCDYRLVTLNADMTKMSIATETATGDATISADDAKAKLKESMQSIITAKLTATGYGALAGSAASQLANAYVYHAEGNENSSTDAKKCLSILKIALSVAKNMESISDEQYTSFSALLNSMLQDKSNYGDAEREDQTNDRTLTDISMPPTWDGSGTQDDPYLIKSTFQLNLLAMRVNNGESYSGKFFKLANDITYTHTTDWDDASSTENNYTAIGQRLSDDDEGDNPFSGTFDGDGYTVSGIRIYKSGGSGWSDHFAGIFGYVTDGTVKNVTLADARITGEQNVGGIVGNAVAVGGTCTIENCHVLSNVTIHAVADYSHYHGGIVGCTMGSDVLLCTSAATLTIKEGITGCKWYGGIVGSPTGGTLRNNLAIGATISAVDNSGAIAGDNYNYNCTFEYNYYSSCTVGSKTSGIGRDGADIEDEYDNQNVLHLDCAVPATILSDAETTLPALTAREKVAFRREFTGGKASTVVFPFYYTPSAAEGKYYTFSGVGNDGDKWIVTMNEYTGATLEANTPYLFMPAGSDGIVPVLFHGEVVDEISAGTTVQGDWTFTGTYERKQWDSTHNTDEIGSVYGFAAQAGTSTDGQNTAIEAGNFFRVAGGPNSYIVPFRAYLKYTGTAHGNAPAYSTTRSASASGELPAQMIVRLVGSNGETTSLSEELRVKSEEFATAAEWYDLSGRKLDGKPSQRGIYINNGKKVVVH